VPTLTVSESSRRSLAHYGLRDLTLVPEGIDRRPRPDVPRESRPTIVFLGRLARNKGPLEALAAFELLRRRMPEAQMWIVGDGPQRSAVAEAAGDGVTLFGRVDRAERDQLLARAHALVVTSVREGWGLVVDEAANMGTPAVAYDRPGLRDSVPPARGVLVDPNPAALADALERELPAWTASPATEGWAGGAVDWDTVAEEILSRALGRVRAIGAPREPRARADRAVEARRALNPPHYDEESPWKPARR
jgi:glycosyltransferase involved in cell wall biosynthesis